MLLPGTTSGGALEVAEKLRSAVESLVFTFGPKPLRVTSSFGAASLGPAGVKELDALLQNADRALYQAKTNGRNRSVLWQEPRATVFSVPGGAP